MIFRHDGWVNVVVCMSEYHLFFCNRICLHAKHGHFVENLLFQKTIGFLMDFSKNQRFFDGFFVSGQSPDTFTTWNFFQVVFVVSVMDF